MMSWLRNLITYRARRRARLQAEEEFLKRMFRHLPTDAIRTDAIQAGSIRADFIDQREAT